MSNIIIGQALSLAITLKVGGRAVSLPADSVVSAQLVAEDGDTTIGPAYPVLPTALGANFANGLVIVEVPASVTATLLAGTVYMLVTAAIGSDDQTWRFPLTVGSDTPEKSALFVRNVDLPKLRGGHLAACAPINASKLSDDYLWDAMVAGENMVQRELSVFLEPTEVFPISKPTPDEIAELNGRPFVVEPGYDVPPDFFSVQKWGALQLRQSLVTEIKRVVVAYPSVPTPIFTVPPEWIFFDAKGGILNIVPGSSSGLSAPLSVFTMQAMAAGYTVPHMLRVRYTAGLTKTHPLYASVRDLALRGAVLRLLHNSFLPQSASVSADGLSQSKSFDVSKYEEQLMSELYSLKQRLKGIVWGVV